MLRIFDIFKGIAKQNYLILDRKHAMGKESQIYGNKVFGV